MKTHKEQLQEEILRAQEELAKIEAEEQLKLFRVKIRATVVWVDYLKADSPEEAEQKARDKFDLPYGEIGDGSTMEITGVTSIETVEAPKFPCPTCSELMEPSYVSGQKLYTEGQEIYRCSRHPYKTFVFKDGKLEEM
jgi:hypothetical protein